MEREAAAEERRAAQELAAAGRAEADKAARIVRLWNAGRMRRALFYPTIGAAIVGGFPILAFHCPGCRQVGSVDLRTLDRHPGAPVSSLIPSLSCRRCAPNPPFAVLDELQPSRPAAERGLSIGGIKAGHT